MKKLTAQMKQDYLDSGGSNCPFCKSSEIEAHSGFNFEGGQVWENVKCNACSGEWREVYDLTTIEEI